MLSRLPLTEKTAFFCGAHKMGRHVRRKLLAEMVETVPLYTEAFDKKVKCMIDQGYEERKHMVRT